MHALYLLCVTTHLLAMAVWVGSMLAFVVVVLPVLRVPELAEVRAEVLQRAATRVRWVGWLCLALLAFTGGFQAWMRFGSATLAGGGDLGAVLRWKIALFALLVALQAGHDFWIGPRASTALAPGGARWARRFGRVALGVTLVLVGMGVVLVRGVPA